MNEETAKRWNKLYRRVFLERTIANVNMLDKKLFAEVVGAFMDLEKEDRAKILHEHSEYPDFKAAFDTLVEAAVNYGKPTPSPKKVDEIRTALLQNKDLLILSIGFSGIIEKVSNAVNTIHFKRFEKFRRTHEHQKELREPKTPAHERRM